MAVRTPVVTTSKGCEGIEHGGAFRVADSASEFRSGLLQLLTDPDAAEQSACDARAVFDRLYSVPANAALLEQALAGAARVRSQRRVPA
jgi:hypothetical protein